MLGGLFCAGWTIDEMMSLTWDQIQLVAESMLLHRIWMFNMVAEPVSEALGGAFKGGKVTKPKLRRKQQQQKATNPQAKDDILVSRIGAMGFPITTGK